MTKREYEQLNRVAKDYLGHEIKVGDTVVHHGYCKEVRLGKVTRILNKFIEVQDYDRYYGTDPIHFDFHYPNRVIKIKEDGIPDK